MPLLGLAAALAAVVAEQQVEQEEGVTAVWRLLCRRCNSSACQSVTQGR
jgi:hypothetical protein